MNIIKNSLRASVFILLCTPIALYANDEINTDWLEAKTGSSGATLGTEVIQVKQVDDIMSIDVDIPTDNLKNYGTVEVIGKKSNKPVKLEKQPEILNNDNGEAYGVRLQMKRLPGFEFRLRLYDGSDEPNQ
ncbi:MAG: hypothetical protein QNK31_09745 [Porticoccus sp.]|nr:hypothetical protein [Porticoccus sp.]